MSPAECSKASKQAAMTADCNRATASLWEARGVGKVAGHASGGGRKAGVGIQ